MRGRKGATIGAKPASSSAWSVYESYEISPREVIQKGAIDGHPEFERIDRNVVPQGAVTWVYDLAERDNQDCMLKDFLSVCDEQSALKWTSRWGLLVPGYCDINSVLSAALMIRTAIDLEDACVETEAGDGWNLNTRLPGFFRTFQPNPFFLFLNWYGENGDAETTWRAERLEAGSIAEYFRAVLEKDPTVRTTAEQEFVRFKDELVKQDFEKWLHLTVVSERDEPVFLVQQTRGGHLVVLSHPYTVSYDKREWQDAEIQHRRLLAARTFVRDAVNYMLEGIQPILEWKWSIEHQKWILDTEFRIACPFQAIGLAVMRCQASRVHLKWCKRCRKLLTGRSDQRVCDKAACQRWGSRNLPKIRKARRVK